MHSPLPLARRLAAGVAGILLALGASALPAAASVEEDDVPSYVCDTAEWFNTHHARGEGNCIPFNGAPATGRISERFHIYDRDTPPGRITCLGGGGGYASTPERVSGYRCGPKRPIDGPPSPGVNTCARIVATGFTGYLGSARYADIRNDCDHPVGAAILVPYFSGCKIIEPGETQRRLWPKGLGPHQGLRDCDEG